MAKTKKRSNLWSWLVDRDVYRGTHTRLTSVLQSLLRALFLAESSLGLVCPQCPHQSETLSDGEEVAGGEPHNSQPLKLISKLPSWGQLLLQLYYVYWLQSDNGLNKFKQKLRGILSLALYILTDCNGLEGPKVLYIFVRLHQTRRVGILQSYELVWLWVSESL